MIEKHYTTKEAVLFIHDKTSTVFKQDHILNMVYRGKIKSIKIGTQRFFKEDDLDTFCKTHRFVPRRRKSNELISEESRFKGYTKEDLLFMRVSNKLARVH